MNAAVARLLIVTGACLLGLTGCESLNKTAAWFGSPPSSQDSAAAPPAEPDPTGSVPLPAAEPIVVAPINGDPNDDLNLGKRNFRAGNFGLAERYFRRAVEKKAPGERGQDAEAWLGLAASYDRLRRFELADRAYAQAIKIAGPTPEILNNHGYSYLLRGDYARARAKLTAAYERDPKNPYIHNNLELLERSVRAQR